MSGEKEAARWVRGMFGRVAGRYDLANHLLSFNIDRYWRAVAVKRTREIWTQADTRVLDLCCGTGDLLAGIERARGRPAYGADFCHPMLTAAARKLAARSLGSPLFEADALQLPLADASLDLIAVAFGFRNFANYDAGLLEMRRVLRPGGMAAILEFSQPPNAAFASLYGFYSRRLLPVIGGMVSGERDAYTYLPESVRKFPSAEELAGQMRRAGFERISFERMTFGIVALHLARVAGLRRADTTPNRASLS